MKLYGEYNDATIHTNAEQVDASAMEQISEMVNSPAFIGDSDISIMPDFHWGSGAVIGFTMPVKDRVVPNTIGVDIGCGMFAINLGNIEFGSLEEVDSAVRERIPTGFDVHSRNDYHMINDFPWNACEQKWDRFAEATEFDLDTGEIPQYPRETYFEDLCKRVGYDQGRAINSVGTLGGGNHFIEFGRDSEDNVWVIIHSGSRGIGANIAQYWQDVATDKMNERAMEAEIPDSVEPYLGEDWKPKADKIRANFDGKAIQEKFNELSQFIQSTKQHEQNRNTDLDYLEGEEAHGYIRDMIFAQTYASVSRKEMAVAVVDAIRSLQDEPVSEGAAPVWWNEQIESVHNYIDFEDATIRKGACRAHENEWLVVPLNMKYGTLLCKGKGRSDWNNSSAHGAGRAMSRTAAHEKFSDSDFDEQTEGVYMSKQPMDEIPQAYKDPESVERALGDSVEVVDRVVPFLSIKAE